MTNHHFPKKIYSEDIIQVLRDDELKTSEIIQRLKETENLVGDYKTITQDGVLRVLKKMAKNDVIEGDLKRFGFWMWKKKEENKEQEN